MTPKSEYREPADVRAFEAGLYVGAGVYIVGLIAHNAGVMPDLAGMLEQATTIPKRGVEAFVSNISPLVPIVPAAIVGGYVTHKAAQGFQYLQGMQISKR